MRKRIQFLEIIAIIILVLFNLDGFGKTSGCRYLFLSGTINGIYHVEMNLTIAVDTLYGNYLVVAGKNPPGKSAWPGGEGTIPLYGKINARGTYVIRENPREKGAVFTGKFATDKTFKGEWKSPDGKIIYPFELKEASEPGVVPFDVTFREGNIPLLKKSSSPKAHFEYCLLTPKEPAGKGVSDSVYRIIISAFYGKSVRKVDPEILVTSLEKSYSENYISTNSAIYDKEMGMSFNWESVKCMDIVHNSASHLTFYVEQYSFTGGAHGLQTRDYLNVNLKKGRSLTLKEVFRGEYEKTLTKLITDKIKKTHDIPEDVKLSEHGFFVENVKPTENFYLTSNGIGFYYNHYEIAPHSNGPDDVFLPYSELKGLVFGEGIPPQH